MYTHVHGARVCMYVCIHTYVCIRAYVRKSGGASRRYRGNEFLRSKFNLLTVPPKKPVIYTGASRRLAKTLQPFNEGSEMSLLCEVIGGSPPPKVAWYFKGKMLDDTYTQEHDDITINRLDISKVTRDFLNARLICKANNTQLMTPLVSEIVLDLNRE